MKNHSYGFVKKEQAEVAEAVKESDKAEINYNFKCMLYKYLSFSLSITMISWVVGMLINYFLRNAKLYKEELLNINLIKSEKLNRVIGLGVFKWIVRNTFFRFFNQKLKLRNKIEKTDLTVLRDEMTKSEIDHLIGFAFVTIFAFLKILENKYSFALVMMGVNILLNLYPSLLQQENKRRIDKFIKKLQLT